MRFIDEIEIGIASGSGGDGCASFHRDANERRGGPDGGNGGRGGDLIVEATAERNTLSDFRRNKWYRAENGRPGTSGLKNGPQGADSVVFVPVGTVVTEAETGELLADLDVEGARFVLRGGEGGLGNLNFKSATLRTPTEAEPGQPGEERLVRLELKLIADVGLVGFPNAGKSSFIQAVTRSRSEVASYPFTTLHPRLGVVLLNTGHRFVLADLPGLIEGASEGAGLGHDFLRHVQRCRAYLHLVAPESWEGEVGERYRIVRDELLAYDEDLAARPEFVVLTKADDLSEEERSILLAELAEASGAPVFLVSSRSGEGIPALIEAVWNRLLADAAVAPPPPPGTPADAKRVRR